MILKNIEGLEEYNILEGWYKNRKKGISAYMRVKDEERWIGACIESILPFFDEIIVALDGTDRTRDILESFDSKKIKIYDYPFALHILSKKYPTNSVHNVTYYYNWTLSKTTTTHASKWDADMIMLPEFCTKDFYDYVLEKNVVRVKGYEIVTDDFRYISKYHPWSGPEIRFFKINKNIYYYPLPSSGRELFTYHGLLQLTYPNRWLRFPYVQMKRITNGIIRKDVKLKKPVFFHTKYLRKWSEKFIPALKIKGKIDKGSERGDRLWANVPNFVFKK